MPRHSLSFVFALVFLFCVYSLKGTLTLATSVCWICITEVLCLLCHVIALFFTLVQFSLVQYCRTRHTMCKSMCERSMCVLIVPYRKYPFFPSNNIPCPSKKKGCIRILQDRLLLWLRSTFSWHRFDKCCDIAYIYFDPELAKSFLANILFWWQENHTIPFP